MSPGMVSTMLRFCLTVGALCLILGCSGRSIEGRWHGQMPLIGANDCQIRLRKAGAFDFICAQPGDWAGNGAYTATGDDLVLTLTMAVNEGRLLKKLPAPIRLKMQGGGNELTLVDEGGMKMGWKRKVE